MSDCVRVTTVVAVDPAAAFAIFTEEVDLWWKRGPRFRVDADCPSVMRFEPRVGGRLLELYEPASGEAYVHGEIRLWQPPERLVFEMRGRDFEPDQSTEVEISFEAVADGTRVSVEHRGWAELPGGHPAFHGLDGAAFDDMMTVWWADLLAAGRAHARRSGPPSLSTR